MRKAMATHTSAVEFERVIHGLFRRFPSPLITYETQAEKVRQDK